MSEPMVSAIPDLCQAAGGSGACVTFHRRDWMSADEMEAWAEMRAAITKAGGKA